MTTQTNSPDEEIERAGLLYQALLKINPLRRLTFEAFFNQIMDTTKFRDWAKTDRLLNRCKWERIK